VPSAGQGVGIGLIVLGAIMVRLDLTRTTVCDGVFSRGDSEEAPGCRLPGGRGNERGREVLMGEKLRIERITIDPDPYEQFRLAQGYRVGDILVISGQAAISSEGELVGVGDFDAQAEQVFANLERVLHAGGSSLKNVIKVTIFLTDIANFPKIVELRRRHFTAPYPADTIVEVTSLYSPDAMIEIEAIAIADDALGPSNVLD
jgi:2-iminobutanoate/2-iminopropanoate deaminase